MFNLYVRILEELACSFSSDTDQTICFERMRQEKVQNHILPQQYRLPCVKGDLSAVALLAVRSPVSPSSVACGATFLTQGEGFFRLYGFLTFYFSNMLINRRYICQLRTAENSLPPGWGRWRASDG